ncbi:MAG: hypothetical protein IKM29_00170 [Clostridia bacterium]|nr:hypothetical protein [Clostridia bacterium]
MKKSTVLLVLLTVLILLSGCDYYSDEHISITYDEPDIIGVNEYEAGVSTEKNAARIFRLGYEIDVITDGQIKVTLPEKIKDEIGTEYPIDSFGGPTGTNAPSRKFKLFLQIQEGTAPKDPLILTIDVGALPLNTSYWDDIEIEFSADGTVTQVPLETVIFLSDEPLVYDLLLKKKNDKGSVSDAVDTDMWYHLPDTEYHGGEKVILQLKPHGEGIERRVTVSSKVLEPVQIQEEYVQYEFIMPYHGVTVMITDTPG